ncbi:DedA family protein [Rossellomorea vietnamensis]|uniref:DedA family protein n=1 Tax=Rossellomorea vietnamensis TaxID=218284 RepID=A0A5D4MJF5_9BACI|nr:MULTISPECIES: DedA family protein [Bacillaceae]TYS01519.1 DedA family protein [Rossellomorea vietnamensis]
MALLIELVDDLGYFAMFIFSWLIFIGLPLPNEAAAAFSGVLTEWRGYSPSLAFTSTYMGIISSGTFGYGVGRLAKVRVLSKMETSKSQRLFRKAQSWLKKYGPIGISFSYFIPGVRLVMPYIAGASGISFRTFMMAAYPAAFIWCMIYFQIGRLFPSTFTLIIENLSIAIAAAAGAVMFIMIGYLYYRKRRRSSRSIVKGGE